MSVQSDWLTAVRLTRLAQILASLSSNAPGVPVLEFERAAWGICGGPYEEVSRLLAVLTSLGLTTRSDESIRRNRDGDQIARAVSKGDWTRLGICLVRAGYFHDQARRMVEAGEVGPDGTLRCPLRIARTNAPQLLGLLQWWEEVRIQPEVFVPKPLVDELNAIWALIPPAVELPKWAAERKEIGNRAEMYTVQVERLRAANPSDIHWVARDSDSLGWDVEDRSCDPLRRIEVKGSRESDPRFYLSENEWKRAHDFGPAYEVQFWGEINLSRSPAIEFNALRAAGYPLVVRNVAYAIASGAWAAVAVTWRVTRVVAETRTADTLDPSVGSGS